MDNFTYYAPTYFAFGKDVENDVGKYVKQFGGSNVLVHYGGESALRSGLIDRVEKSLLAHELKFTLLGGVKPNPRSGLVYEGIDICKREGIDFVLAIGGGSTIDSAKAIAAGVLYDGDFWDYYQGKHVEKALPVGTILTIAAAGSEGSTGSVITHEDGMYKRAANSDALRPKFSLLNPELTFTLPPYQTASGVTDIMAHLMERYMTNTRDVEVTDRIIEGLLLAVINEAPKVMINPENYGARANIMWAGTVAHNNSAGVGRSEDWVSHDIEHELSAKYDVAHGAGLAVVMPQVMRYNLHHDIDRFVQLATRVFGVELNEDNLEETALLGISRFQEFLVSLGMPKNFEEIGALEEDIDELTHMACYGDGREGYLEGFTKLDAKDVKRIYEMCL